MDNLFDIISNDYVRTFTSLAGLLISIINSIYLISTNTFNIDLIQKSYLFSDNRKMHPIAFEFAIENNSRIQVSVLRMFLLVNDQRYEFQWDKERIRRREHKTNDEVIEAYSTYSLTLPQSISGLGAIGGFFFVNTSNELNRTDFLNSKVYVEVWTNRGKKKFKVNLSNLSDHL